MRASKDPLARQRLALVMTMVALLAQFMLGTAVNLFVKIPPDHPGANPPEYFGGVVTSVTWAITGGTAGLLALHAVLGLVLVVSALLVLLRARATGSRAQVVVGWIGLLGIIAAGFNGGSFLNYAEDFSSMLMATGFTLAFTAYLIGLYRAHPSLQVAHTEPLHSAP